MLNTIVGQEEAVRCLRRFVEGKLQNPLLLVGDEGVGRKASVLAAAREILVSYRGDKSPEVFQFDSGVHPDVFVVSTEAGKDLGVDAIRDAIEASHHHPVASPLRFFIIEGADRMTPAAANAILKTIEEPTDFARFFLLAESYDRVIPTIRSRCGRVDYRKLPESFVLERISKFERNPDKALVYTRLSEGSIGRATRYWGSNRIAVRDRSMEIIQQAITGDLPSAFGIVDDLSKELDFVLRCLVFVLHDVLVVSVTPERTINRDVLEDLVEMANRADIVTWSNLWKELRTVWSRNESSYVNLSFQIKTALVAGLGK